MSKSSTQKNNQKEQRNVTVGSGKKNINNTRNKALSEEYKNYFLVPIFIVLCILPFIVRVKVYHTHLSNYNWYAEDDSFVDFFLYYRHWIFVILAGVMTIIIAVRAYSKKYKIEFAPLFIPLAVYGIMALISAIFSNYAFFSFRGFFEMFESVFAILGYCIVTYYAFLFVQKENDFKKIMRYIIVVSLIMSIFGFMQFIGKDLIGTELFYRLIVPVKFQDGQGFKFTFENNRVYLTLYNPNYVGVFTALIIPIILVIMFFQRNLKSFILSIMAIIGLLVSLVGSRSQAGVIGLVVALFCMLILLWRYLLKRYYISLSVAGILIIGVVVLNQVTDQLLLNRLKTAFSSIKSEYALSEMHTEDDCVSLTYNGNKLNVRYLSGDGYNTYLITDENEEVVPVSYDESTHSYAIIDDRFTGISVGNSDYVEGGFYIQESGQQWHFTSQTEDGTYYYFNRFGKLDKMITAPSALFTGYEWFATARGYIWSRTIPLLKDYIFIGSGPDTYTLVFPQQDYLNFQRYGYGSGIITKPHNMYLQTWVQNGFISLLGFLVFYGMYFVMSIRLYIRGCFKSYYSQVGVAIFVGTIGYMVTGITNDSNITTAPLFWAIIGIGIAANYKAKPFIMEEVKELKAAKENRKNEAMN